MPSPPEPAHLADLGQGLAEPDPLCIACLELRYELWRPPVLPAALVRVQLFLGPQGRPRHLLGERRVRLDERVDRLTLPGGQFDLGLEDDVGCEGRRDGHGDGHVAVNLGGW